MFTTIAYRKTIDGSLLPLDGIADDHVTVIGESILVPRLTPKIAAASVSGVATVRGRIASPSLEAFNLIDVTPMSGSALPSEDDPAPFTPFFNNPVPLVVDESLRALASTSAPDAATIVYWLMDNLEPLPTVAGERLPIRSINYETSVTLTADTWSDVPLSGGVLQTLKAGRYALVGMRCNSATAVAARVKFVGEGVDHRPGCIGVNGIGNREHQIFRLGNLGTWGEFEHNQLPIIQVLANAADTDQIITLDLIKIR